MEVIRKMFEMFEHLLGNFSEIIYNAYWNQKYLEENQDLIYRCADRADIVYEAEFSDELIFRMEKFRVVSQIFKMEKIKRPYIQEVDLTNLEMRLFL
jgi:hypothetical protein